MELKNQNMEAPNKSTFEEGSIKKDREEHGQNLYNKRFNDSVESTLDKSEDNNSIKNEHQNHGKEMMSVNYFDDVVGNFDNEKQKEIYYTKWSEINRKYDGDFEKYSQDPEWREIVKEAFPDYELPELKNSDNVESWNKISSEETLQQRASAVNPNYEESKDNEWSNNCQRCVATYEMRARGYDVTAKPLPEYDGLKREQYAVWQSPEVIYQSVDVNKIENQMKEWGDGSRAQICFNYQDDNSKGHTFVAEQIDGKTYFIDPQTGDLDCKKYFDDAQSGSITFCRIDQLQPTDKIHDCCTAREDNRV